MKTLTKEDVKKILGVAKKAHGVAEEAMAFSKKESNEKMKALMLAKDFNKFSKKVLDSSEAAINQTHKASVSLLEAINIYNEQMVKVELFLKTLKTTKALAIIKSLNIADKIIFKKMTKAGFKGRKPK